MNGREIVSPLYDILILSSDGFNYKSNGKYIPLGIDRYGNRISTASTSSSSSSSSSSYSSRSSSSSSSSSASSSSSSRSSYTSSSSYSSPSTSSQTSSSSQYGRLLFQGTYTSTGVCRNSNSITGCGQVSLDYITVYERALLRSSNDEVLPFVNYVTIYGETGRRYGNGQLFFMVTDQGAIRFVALTGTDILVMYNDQGDTRSQYMGKIFSTPLTNGGNNYNSNNYNSNNNGGTYNRPQHQRRCTVCHGTGLCPICNGSKMVTNSFGHKGLSKCKVCNFTGLCTSCNGTGRK